MPDEPSPYTVVFSILVADQAAALPKAARIALADALEDLRRDPWNQPRYHPRITEEMRSATFGDGFGFLIYVISKRGGRIIVTHLTWFDT